MITAAALSGVRGHAETLPSPTPSPAQLVTLTEGSEPTAPTPAQLVTLTEGSGSTTPAPAQAVAVSDVSPSPVPSAAPEIPSASSLILSKIGFSVLVPVTDQVFTPVGIGSARGNAYLFLPSVVRPENVILQYDKSAGVLSFADGTPAEPGIPVNLTPYLSTDCGDGSRELTLTLSGTPLTIRVMASSGIPSVYLTSADPVKAGRAFVEKFKGNKAKGSMLMLTASGTPVYAGTVSQIKARGNTTFFADKKPYQIKLDAAADLSMTDPSNANKTWLLIANAFDPTLIHNTAAFAAAKKMGIEAPDGVHVDLYYDGEYRGNYLLCEKVETGKGRVKIADLEKENEKANAPVNTEKLPVAKGKNAYGGTYQYVKGMKDPADISGGYLLELDAVYYESERSYFVTSTGTPFVVKSPEDCSENEMIYISEYMERILRAASNGGKEPAAGEDLWDLVDLDSLASSFVLQQFTKNADAFTSSSYFYLDRGGKLMSGPVWDLDDSYGIREDMAGADGFVGMIFMEPFTNLPEFRHAVKAAFTKNRAVAGGSLIDGIASGIASSEKMDRVLWYGHDIRYREAASCQEDISYMKRFASSRASWLGNRFAGW